MSEDNSTYGDDPYYVSDSALVAFLEENENKKEDNPGDSHILPHPVNDKTIRTDTISGAVQVDTLKIVTMPPAQEHKEGSREQGKITSVGLPKAPTSSGLILEVNGVTIMALRGNGNRKRTEPTLHITPAKRECVLNKCQPFEGAMPKIEGLKITITDNDEAQFHGSEETAWDPPPYSDTDEMIDTTDILQLISYRQQNFPKFNSVMHIDHFRFVNLDSIKSYPEMLTALHSAIQTVLDRVLAGTSPGDFVQLRLKGGNFLDCVLSSKYSHEDFNALDILKSVAGTLQSNGECLRSVTLKLVATVLKNRRGGVQRRLKSIAYSQIIKQKKRWLFDFNNFNSNLCLAASIYALLADSDITDAIIISRAMQLHKDLSISDSELVSFDDIAKFEKHLGINIKVLYHSQDNWKYFHTDSSPTGRIVYILHHEDHYYGIKNVKGFLGEAYFCQQCSSVFHHKNSHSCKYFCKACQRDDCVKSDGEQPKCPSCRIFCRSRECFEHHQRLAKGDKLLCKPKTFCDSCVRYVGSDINHECKGLSCNVCGVSLDRYSSHQCYMQPYTPPEVTEKYIIYDYVYQKDTRVPNFIYCTTLKGNLTWEFEGKACLQEFVKFFTSGKFNGFTFITHDAGRYEAHFVVQALIEEKLQVKLITRGHKMLSVSLPDLKLRFIDFQNFLPMNLVDLPAATGCPGSVGYFPHSFNTEVNQTYIGPLPPNEYYDVDYMTPGDRKVFLAWYEEHKNTIFNLQSELRSHCQQAVEVLRLASERYRDRVMEASKKQVTIYCKLSRKYLEVDQCVDPFQLISLHSVCMAMYRFNFLPKNTIGILPGDNYHSSQKRPSTPAIQWLMYVAHTENIPIQHALNGGEKRVGKYLLDGYARIDGKDIAFEFLQCFRGCPICRKTNDCNDAPKPAYSQVYHIFMAKKQYLLRCGFTIRALCGHEWKEMLERDGSLQDFLHEKQFPTPLDPRDALYQGDTTETIKLYHKAEPGETIHYYQITSLYPFVNKTKPYPVGHPEIIVENFGPINQYFGLAKVKVYPPRGLFFPVLPMKMNKDIIFPLCYTCAVNRQGQRCSHNDEERSLTGTWCTIELQMAVEKGYRIAQIHEVWHFSNTTDELFAPYIDLHRRDHQEALGYPNWCTDDDKKKQYIDSFLEKEGIQLRADNIMANPTKRQISDLFMNSLWGKFSQRSNLPQTSMVTDPHKLFWYVFQPTNEISEVNFIDGETAAVNLKFTKEYPKPNKNANIFIAIFTMAHARLELYSLLDRLQRRCFYSCADAVVFVSKDGEWTPPLGDQLGGLTSKLPQGTHITEFVSAGDNTYGYRLNTGEAVLNCNGMYMNVDSTQEINFDSIKEFVLEGRD